MSGSILIISCSNDLGQRVGRACRECGFHARHSPDAIHGIMCALDETPHAIILDVDGAGVDGLQLCQQIKHDRQLASVPIIVLVDNLAQPTTRRYLPLASAVLAKNDDRLQTRLTPFLQ